MRYLQLLIFELSQECNLAGEHPLCPINDPARWQVLDTRRMLDDDTIIGIACRAYRKFHFRGLIGFHFYNEPLLSKDRMLRLVSRIRGKVPAARFVLWTNGSLIASPGDELAVFERIHITNYKNGDFSFLKGITKNLIIEGPKHDLRRYPVLSYGRGPCFRPFAELIIDCFGNAHSCSVDWAGKASPGNVFTSDFSRIIQRHEEARDRLCEGKMSKKSPQACLYCTQRYNSIARFDCRIADESARIISPRKNFLRRLRRCFTMPAFCQHIPAVSQEVAVVVPTHKAVLTETERLSLQQLEKYLAAYKKFLIVPKGLCPDYGRGFQIVEFDRKHFESHKAHNFRFRLSEEFYRPFRDYRYILIYELDSLVFSDQLKDWCQKGYDYIGAPWMKRDLSWPEEGRVGNGGFSLRRVESCLKAIRAYHLPRNVVFRLYEKFVLMAGWKDIARQILNLRINAAINETRQLIEKVFLLEMQEDIFLGEKAKKWYPAFKVAPRNEAVSFSMEENPRICFEKNHNRYPFGCHGWMRHGNEFWEPLLKGPKLMLKS